MKNQSQSGRHLTRLRKTKNECKKNIKEPVLVHHLVLTCWATSTQLLVIRPRCKKWLVKMKVLQPTYYSWYYRPTNIKHRSYGVCTSTSCQKMWTKEDYWICAMTSCKANIFRETFFLFEKFSRNKLSRGLHCKGVQTQQWLYTDSTVIVIESELRGVTSFISLYQLSCLTRHCLLHQYSDTNKIKLDIDWQLLFKLSYETNKTTHRRGFFVIDQTDTKS